MGQRHEDRSQRPPVVGFCGGEANRARQKVGPMVQAPAPLLRSRKVSIWPVTMMMLSMVSQQASVNVRVLLKRRLLPPFLLPDCSVRI